MTDFSELVEAYKREVAIPGTFPASFPLTTDRDIEGSLADAFAEAQLDGFFRAVSLDVDDRSVSPDLSAAGGALVVIYAGIRLVRQQMVSLATAARYEAGPVKYETKMSASVLAEVLKALELRKARLIEAATGATSTYVLDGYLPGSSHGGFYSHEAPALGWV